MKTTPVLVSHHPTIPPSRGVLPFLRRTRLISLFLALATQSFGPPLLWSYGRFSFSFLGLHSLTWWWWWYFILSPIVIVVLLRSYTILPSPAYFFLLPHWLHIIAVSCFWRATYIHTYIHTRMHALFCFTFTLPFLFHSFTCYVLFLLGCRLSSGVIFS